MRTKEEIQNRFQENTMTLVKMREEIKKERLKHLEIRDVGYIDSCRERLYLAVAENDVLLWVFGEDSAKQRKQRMNLVSRRKQTK